MSWVRVTDLECFLREHDLLPAIGNCPECDAVPGQVHKAACDVERCSACGWQRVRCRCETHDNRFARWTGFWPGELECLAVGMLSRWEPDPSRPTMADKLCRDPKVDVERLYSEGLSKIFFIKPMQPERNRKADIGQNAMNPDRAGQADDPIPSLGEVFEDPAISFWLKRALNVLLERDPVDALNDVTLLARILDRECKKALQG